MNCEMMFEGDAVGLSSAAKKDFVEDFRLAVLKYIKSREGEDQYFRKDKDVKVWDGYLNAKITKSDDEDSVCIGVIPDNDDKDPCIIKVKGWTDRIINHVIILEYTHQKYQLEYHEEQFLIECLKFEVTRKRFTNPQFLSNNYKVYAKIDKKLDVSTVTESFVDIELEVDNFRTSVGERFKVAGVPLYGWSFE